LAETEWAPAAVDIEPVKVGKFNNLKYQDMILQFEGIQKSLGLAFGYSWRR
jgi:hypothetical protein